MKDARYFRDKAQQCRNLADIAGNPELTSALDELAREFDEKAVELKPAGSLPGSRAVPAARQTGASSKKKKS